ncbi:MAG TPA: zinc-binding alcohol dehydrogenase [Candidatus Binataceae bacterium]|nr:zinc-binding alcohol dehydrogenase [Candidatus Binataceae bacterium]
MSNPTIVFERPQTVAIHQREKPVPAAAELLIQSRLSLISTGTELTILSGDFPEKSVWAMYGRYPFVAGYSNVGVVADVGAGIDRSWIGKRVATRAPHTAWVSAPMRAAVMIPDEVRDEDAAFFAIAGIVMNAVRRARVAWGESIVVYGLGILGQLAARFAQIAGARKVFGVDVADARLALLPESPSIVPTDARHGEIAPRVRNANRGRLADVVFEVTGDPSLITGEFSALRRQGRFVVLSSPRGPALFDFHDLCNAPSYTIIGAHEMSHPAAETLDNPWTNLRHYELFFDYIAARRLDVAPLLSHRVPYAQAPATYRKLLTDRSSYMGVLIDWRD